ncbi:MAG: hypothetical protein SGI88_01175 [Candidatus Hydrogenedentes bacterium]|nr:hypothetical protein [Candidatus Hydrogenedentota bacterium]
MGTLLIVLDRLDTWIEPLRSDEADCDAHRVPTRNIVRIFVRLNPEFQDYEETMVNEMGSCEYYLHREAWLDEIIRSGL